MIEWSELTLEIEQEEETYNKEIEQWDEKLKNKDVENESLELQMKDTRTTIGDFFAKRVKQTTYADASVQAVDEEDKDDDEMNVDEMDSGPLSRNNSTVELDIFKYGSWVKQAMNSSFMTDMPMSAKKPKRR